MKEYPNIDFLVSIFNKRRLARHREGKWPQNNIGVYVFPQWWPNTGGGFSEPGYFYGDAMTQQHTTVIIDESDGLAMVSFDNTPAYLVEGLYDVFSNDVSTCRIRGVSQTKAYVNDGGKVTRLREDGDVL